MNRIVFRSFRKRNRSQKNTNTVYYSVYFYSGIVPNECALHFRNSYAKNVKGFFTRSRRTKNTWIRGRNKLNKFETNRVDRFRNSKPKTSENTYIHVFLFTVTSTTLPVTLKCSSHFIIDEINLYLKNRTNILLTASSSTAPQQCNQTHQEVGGRHECHFNINYDAVGIDSFSVHSVDVEYHCMD